jgi:hypothetical protein
MKSGASGESVMVDKNGNAVVVAGKYGNGRVLAVGFPIGYASIEPGSFEGRPLAPEGAEKQLLINGIRWIGKANSDSKKFLLENMDADSPEKRKKQKARSVMLRAALEDFSYGLPTRLMIVRIETNKIIDEQKREKYLAHILKLEKNIEKTAELFKLELNGIFSKSGTDLDKEFLKKVKRENSKAADSITELFSLVNAAAKKQSRKSNDEWADQFQRGIYAFHYMEKAAPYCDDKNTVFRPTTQEALQIADGELGVTINYITHAPQFYEDDKDINKVLLKELLDWHKQNNIKLFFPLYFNGHFQPKTGWNNIGEMQSVKKYIKKVISACNGHPGFGGFVFDEPFSVLNKDIFAKTREIFKAYLEKKYSRADLAEMEINDSSLAEFFKKVLGSKHSVFKQYSFQGYKAYESLRDAPQKKNRILWFEYERFRDVTLEAKIKEIISYTHSLQADVAVVPLMMVGTKHNTTYPLIAPLSNFFTIDFASGDTRMGAFYADLIRPACKKRFWIMPGYEFVDQAGWERNIAFTFAHADGFWVWEWESCWKYPPRPTNYLDPKKAYMNGDTLRGKIWRSWAWEPTKKLYQKAKKIKDYLYPTESGAKAAIIVSGETMKLDNKYFNKQKHIYHYLSKNHIQTDIIYAQLLTPEKLKQYEVLLVMGAKLLMPEQASILKTWTENGGCLITSGQTGLLNTNYEENRNYSIADILGCSYKGKNSFKIATGSNPVLIGTKSVKALKVKSSLNQVDYDKVVPINGKTAFYWPDGNPALIVNKCKKGKSFFITAQTGLPKINCFNSRAGMKDEPILLSIVKKAFGKSLPFKSSNCPENVEISLRLQKNKQRKIVHLTDFDYSVGKAPLTDIRLSIDAGSDSKVFYATDKKGIKYEYRNGKISFTVRGFTLHEIIIIEDSSIK